MVQAPRGGAHLQSSASVVSPSVQLYVRKCCQSAMCDALLAVRGQIIEASLKFWSLPHAQSYDYKELWGEVV